MFLLDSWRFVARLLWLHVVFDVSQIVCIKREPLSPDTLSMELRVQVPFVGVCATVRKQQFDSWLF